MPGSSNTVVPFVLVTTLAGDGDGGWLDGPGGGAPGSAEFQGPFGVAVDRQGGVYVADGLNRVIRKLTPDGTSTTLAGSVLDAGFADGPGATALFGYPTGVAVDSNGNVFVADSQNARIREVAPDGTTSTFAGNGDAGSIDGTPPLVEFVSPYGVAVDSSDNVYVGDTFGMRIRKITPDGTTSTLSGNGDAGWSDGTGGADGLASFYLPIGVATDANGYTYVGDYLNNRIRKIAVDLTTSTLAGNGDAGFSDGTGGPAGSATFADPAGVAVDAQGNIYVADTANNRIRKVAPDGTTTTVAGDGDAGFLDSPGATAQFWNPFGIAIDLSETLYIADFNNNRIRKVVQ